MCHLNECFFEVCKKFIDQHEIEMAQKNFSREFEPGGNSETTTPDSKKRADFRVYFANRERKQVVRVTVCPYFSGEWEPQPKEPLNRLITLQTVMPKFEPGQFALPVYLRCL